MKTLGDKDYVAATMDLEASCYDRRSGVARPWGGRQRNSASSGQ